MSLIINKYLEENYPNFHWEIYRAINKDIHLSSKLEYEAHFLLYGLEECRKWKITDVISDFDWENYKKLNPQLGNIGNNSQIEYELHYLTLGIHQKLPYNYIYNSNNNISDTIIKQIDNTNNLDALKNILVIIPGFGEPYLDLKIQILEKNIATLAKSIQPNIQIRILIFLYSKDKFHYLANHFKNFSIPVTIFPKTGIIGEFIYKYVDNKLITPFDYLFFILDDIELHPETNIKDLIKLYNYYNMNILGFPLTQESPTPHEFMKIKPEYIKENTPILKVNFVEFFCYFMNIYSFHKYKKFFEETTYWLWGIDLILHNYGFHIYRLEHLPIKHYLKNTNYHKHLPDPYIELNLVKSKYKCISDKKVLSSHPLTIY